MTVKLKGPAIKEEWCKGCGICVAFCPKSVLKMVDNKARVVDGDACISCGLCELRCPDYAIYLRKEGKNDGK